MPDDQIIIKKVACPVCSPKKNQFEINLTELPMHFWNEEHMYTPENGWLKLTGECAQCSPNSPTITTFVKKSIIDDFFHPKNGEENVVTEMEIKVPHLDARNPSDINVAHTSTFYVDQEYNVRTGKVDPIPTDPRSVCQPNGYHLFMVGHSHFDARDPSNPHGILHYFNDQQEDVFTERLPFNFDLGELSRVVEEEQPVAHEHFPYEPYSLVQERLYSRFKAIDRQLKPLEQETVGKFGRSKYHGKGKIIPVAANTPITVPEFGEQRTYSSEPTSWAFEMDLLKKELDAKVKHWNLDGYQADVVIHSSDKLNYKDRKGIQVSLPSTYRVDVHLHQSMIGQKHLMAMLSDFVSKEVSDVTGGIGDTPVRIFWHASTEEIKWFNGRLIGNDDTQSELDHQKVILDKYEVLSAYHGTIKHSGKLFRESENREIKIGEETKRYGEWKKVYDSISALIDANAKQVGSFPVNFSDTQYTLDQLRRERERIGTELGVEQPRLLGVIETEFKRAETGRKVPGKFGKNDYITIDGVTTEYSEWEVRRKELKQEIKRMKYAPGTVIKVNYDGENISKTYREWEEDAKLLKTDPDLHGIVRERRWRTVKKIFNPLQWPVLIASGIGAVYSYIQRNSAINTYLAQETIMNSNKGLEEMWQWYNDLALTPPEDVVAGHNAYTTANGTANQAQSDINLYTPIMITAAALGTLIASVIVGSKIYNKHKYGHSEGRTTYADWEQLIDARKDWADKNEEAEFTAWKKKNPTAKEDAFVYSGLLVPLVDSLSYHDALGTGLVGQFCHAQKK